MNQKYFIGVDVSKSKVDCAVINSGFTLLVEKQVVNSDLKLRSFLQAVLKKQKLDASDLVVCCEATGIYCEPLKRVCAELQVGLWVEQAIKIKRASTDMRGKSDQQDAVRIAEYALRYQDRMALYQPSSQLVKDLDAFIKSRDTLIGQRASIRNQLKEAKSHDLKYYKVLCGCYKATLKILSKSIADIEKKIELLVQEDQEVAKNAALLQSIPGIGPQVAINLIIESNNFKKFSSANQLACYAGVVPFENQSGTMVKRKRTSKMANQKLKTLLHLAALAARRYDEELKAYFIRKVSQGKNKMSVINAIRNKLVHRIMAVIQRGTPYVKEKERCYQNSTEIACVVT